MADPDFDPTAVPIHPAATVMLVRDGDAGLEVLMLRRTTRAAFARGAYVFPGGRVDDADAGAELAPYCDGHDDLSASEMLGVPSGGLAFWVAVVRECFEEAGVLLARRSDGAPLALSENERHNVHDGTLTMIELCKRHDLILDVGSVQYVAHWLTPVGERRRFDTRFFLAPAPDGQEPVHDDTETTESSWITPAAALAGMEAGELMLMPPTIACLKMLVEHPDSASAFAAVRAAGRPERVEPRLRRDADGRFAGISLPGDPDYETLT